MIFRRVSQAAPLALGVAIVACGRRRDGNPRRRRSYTSVRHTMEVVCR